MAGHPDRSAPGRSAPHGAGLGRVAEPLGRVRDPAQQLEELGLLRHLERGEEACPEAVLAALRAHFGPAAGRGMEVRRQVLGDAHVDRAQARQTPFTARFQDFVSRHAWGEIWTDPTLSRRERSMITLTALVAHGHDEERPCTSGRRAAMG